MGSKKKNRKAGGGRQTGAPPSWFSPSNSVNRVREALGTVGRAPWLVGFEAVGIQDFIAANGRPLAMEGASRLVERFDREIRDASGAGSGGGTVFAGLGSLEDTAICSDLVFGIFKEAHGQARPADGKCVDPIVGRDDIRVFLPTSIASASCSYRSTRRRSSWTIVSSTATSARIVARS